MSKAILPPGMTITGNESGIIIKGRGKLILERYLNGLVINGTFYGQELFPGMNIKSIATNGSDWNHYQNCSFDRDYDPAAHDKRIDPSLAAELAFLRSIPRVPQEKKEESEGDDVEIDVDKYLDNGEKIVPQVVDLRVSEGKYPRVVVGIDGDLRVEKNGFSYVGVDGNGSTKIVGVKGNLHVGAGGYSNVCVSGGGFRMN